VFTSLRTVQLQERRSPAGTSGGLCFAGYIAGLRTRCAAIPKASYHSADPFPFGRSERLCPFPSLPPAPFPLRRARRADCSEPRLSLSLSPCLCPSAHHALPSRIWIDFSSAFDPREADVDEARTMTRRRRDPHGALKEWIMTSRKLERHFNPLLARCL